MDYFLTPYGGTEGQIFNLIRNLDRDSFEPMLCVFRYVSDYFQKNLFPCPVISMDIKSFYSPNSYLKLLKLRQYVREKRIDIVQTFFNESAVTVPIALVGSPAKVVSTRRDMGYWYTPGKLFILKRNSRYVSKYLANSFAVKNHLMRSENIPESKIEVIYNCHNLCRFDSVDKDNTFLEKHSIPARAFIIGIVANFRPVKRLEDLIVAFKDIRGKFADSYLVIIGDIYSKYDEYVRLINNLEISNHVRWVEHLDDIIPVMKHFTVGINCSESEGMCNAIIEYMGCGIPVVGTRVGGNCELIKDGENGFLVPAHDPDALAGAVNMLLGDAHLRDRVGKNGRKFVEAEFSEERRIREYEMFYNEIVGRYNEK